MAAARPTLSNRCEKNAGASRRTGRDESQILPSTAVNSGSRPGTPTDRKVPLPVPHSRRETGRGNKGVGYHTDRQTMSVIINIDD